MSVQGTRPAVLISIACLILSAHGVFGDQVEMQNGDHYIGKVVSLSSDTLLLHNDNLGTIRLPRGKVASILLGTNTAPRVAAQPSAAATASLAAAPKASGGGSAVGNDVAASLRSLKLDTNLVAQVQKQVLEGAGPAATTKFNELLDGLNTGKISMGDLRKQAQTAANQARAFEKESGDDSLDGYLSILDQFLKETADVK